MIRINIDRLWNIFDRIQQKILIFNLYNDVTNFITCFFKHVDWSSVNANIYKLQSVD